MNSADTLTQMGAGARRELYLRNAHVGPCAHVIGLQVQRLLVGRNGFLAAGAVCQGGTQLVPQRVVPWPDRKCSPAPQIYIRAVCMESLWLR